MFVFRPGIWEAWGRQGNRKCVILGARGDLGSQGEAGESKIFGFLWFFKVLGGWGDFSLIFIDRLGNADWGRLGRRPAEAGEDVKEVEAGRRQTGGGWGGGRRSWG